MIRRYLYLLFILLSLLFPGSSHGDCESDCRAKYDAARENCIYMFDDRDDADALSNCTDAAKSEYDDCLKQCESQTI
ncbi:MAG TPA: hypothetical protein VMU29_10480 [Smithella sp.]|nr:hypothetical protein [Smithella sp.]